MEEESLGRALLAGKAINSWNGDSVVSKLLAPPVRLQLGLEEILKVMCKWCLRTVGTEALLGSSPQ